MGYPAWGDFVAVAGLSVLLMIGLYGVVLLSKEWKKYMKQRIKTALQKRRNFKDKFRSQYGYSWDYVMVFKIYDDRDILTEHQAKYSMKNVLHQLTAGGLEFRLFYSYQHKEVYCKIRAPLQRLMKEADRINLPVPTDPIELRKICEKGRPSFWDGLDIPDQSPLTPYAPYDYIYCKFIYDSATDGPRPDIANAYKRWPTLVFRESDERSGAVDEDLARVSSPMVEDVEPDVHMSIFRGADRLKLIMSILTCHSLGGCYLDIYKMLRKECILGFFPLHDIVELRSIEEKWLRLFQPPWLQHVDVVKDYFGEKIGLYFLWLGHYTTWLIPVSILGFLTWVWIAVENNNPDAPTVPYFAGVMALWSSFYLEFWKRKEVTTAMQWGMVGFEEEEQTRPQFVGELARSPVDGKQYLYFPRAERIKRSVQSTTIIFGFIIVVIAVIAAIFAIRIAISAYSITASGIASSLMISLQIQVMNDMYSHLALKLNSYENHRTDTDYEDALIAKTFLFQFVNSFSSLFYIGFAKPYLVTIDPCANNACMYELQTTLGTIFLTRLAVGNLQELVTPFLKQLIETLRREQVVKKNKQQSKMKHHVYVSEEEESLMQQDLSEVEKTFVMVEYDIMLGTFDDYAELVMQFGYTTLFIAAFPLAALMSFVNNYVEIRVDAWKLCQLMRRPLPKSCEDIGTWQTILEVISGIAVFTNSALVAFTGSSTIDYQWPERVWIFILMSFGLFGIRFAVSYLIADMPAEVDIQLKRQEYILGKIVDNIGDDDDAVLSRALGLVPDYSVQETDHDPL